MSKKNNRINVPEAREAMDKFKMEAASEVGVNLKQGYNGDISAREAGSVGGWNLDAGAGVEVMEVCCLLLLFAACSACFLFFLFKLNHFIYLHSECCPLPSPPSQSSSTSPSSHFPFGSEMVLPYPPTQPHLTASLPPASSYRIMCTLSH